MEATGVRKLPRRQIMSVNIIRTCRDILEKIPTKVPRVPREGELPQTFSLYLSAQLMFGTVCVYKKQQEYLLVDATSFRTRIRLELSSAIADNDLVSVAKPDQITMPDPVKMAGPKQSGFDPYFGLFKDIDVENVQLPEVQGVDEGEEVEFGSPHTVSSMEEITMKEVSEQRGLFETEIPGEKDLPPLEGLELQALTEEYMQAELSPEAPEKIYPMERTPRASSPPREERQPREHRKRRDVADKESAYVLPKRLFREEDLSMVLPPAEAIRRRRRRHRYLRIDKETQMSKEQLRHNMQTGHTTCRAFILPMPMPSDPTKLLKRPGSDALWKEKTLLNLWERNCREGMSETESDKDRPIWSVPELLARRARTEELPEEGSQVLSEEDRGLALQIPEVEERRAQRPSIEIPREISLSRSMTQLAMEISSVRDESKEESLSMSRRTRGLEGLSPRLDTSPLSASARLPSGEQISRMGKMEELEVLPEEMEPGFHSPPSAQTSVESDIASAQEPVKQRVFRARQNGGAACQANRALWAHLYQHTSTKPTLGESDVLP
ncbi:hypothetical protein C0Q70_10216 [Pomacea canaliculata]|uniref:Rad21/Rec8-like protein N-terminal domain-containing protein n=1 Tax=Pomacea canaliculata TaxID=400727 RepID=A0A2T7PC01_POMCA|nr:hypothetical protein C0Q70_10216 [Pomacea canaliculata]